MPYSKFGNPTIEYAAKSVRDSFQGALKRVSWKGRTRWRDSSLKRFRRCSNAYAQANGYESPGSANSAAISAISSNSASMHAGRAARGTSATLP